MTGVEREYFKIHSELTFHNAVSVMHNASDRAEESMALKFYLWNPIPKEAPFQYSRRAREISSAAKFPTAALSLLPNVQPDPEPAFQRLELSTSSKELSELENQGTAFNPVELTKTVADNNNPAPLQDEFESEEEFQLAMEQYLEQLRDLDKAR
jgi:hypothetical protein